jgi:hypothetical protein
MTTTDRMLETTAIGLACLLAVGILIRAPVVRDDETVLPRVRHLASSRSIPARPAIGATLPPGPTANDEARRLLADMALHD